MRLVPGPAFRLVEEGRSPFDPVLLRGLGDRSGDPYPLPSPFANVWRGQEQTLPDEETSSQRAIGFVCDGALALDSPVGLLTGPAAARFLGLHLDREPQPSNAAVARSLEALKLASRWPRADLYPLTASLYFAGRTPCGIDERRRLPDPAAVSRFIGAARIQSRPEVASRLGAARVVGEWLLWRAAAQPIKEKLYIALARPALIERLPDIAAIVAQAGASGFKVAASAHTLHRLDRCVAYFPDTASRQAAVAGLSPLLAHDPADPVPFTVACNAQARLSWGRDPERGSDMWRTGRSWRLWLCAVLARALSVAMRAPDAELPPWRFALMRIGLCGLDPDTLSPREATHAA